MSLKKPEWWKYEKTSERVYIDRDEPLGLPLLPNYPGTADSLDIEPQRCAPIYVDFERGELFYYAAEAEDLGAK